LVAGVYPDESRWVIDPISECLLPLEKTVPEGPFRICHRAGAATDRLAEGRIAPHSIAALEFSENAGWWTVFSFADAAAHNRWRRPLEAAFRLLADSGLGGERSRGWGCFSIAGIQDGHLPDLILPEAAPPGGEEPASDTVANTHSRGQAWWLLGLLVPGASDEIDWKSGHYSLTTRGGRVESAAGWGIEKKQLRMLAEGSVVECGAIPGGSAPDVAPDGFPHPVFRAGFGLALPVPLRISP
jgi:CRISPR type III-A-associated RAMP protein Csm4